MKVTIESTSKIVFAKGLPCRVWEGETISGIKVQCLIARIAAPIGEDLSQFESELLEVRAPSAEVAAFPLRMVL